MRKRLVLSLQECMFFPSEGLQKNSLRRQESPLYKFCNWDRHTLIYDALGAALIQIYGFVAYNRLTTAISMSRRLTCGWEENVAYDCGQF